MLGAIALGGMLVVFATVVAATLDHRVTTGAGVNFEHADIVVRTSSMSGAGAGERGPDSVGQAGINADDVQKISQLDGLQTADGIVRARAGLWAAGKVTPTVIESLPSESFRWQRLAEGQYPTSGTEVALSSATLKSTGLHLGDEVTMATDKAGDGQFTIVGSVDSRGALDYGDADYAIVTPELARAFSGTEGVNEVRVALSEGADAENVVDQINAAVPGAWPETTESLVNSTKTVYGMGLGALTGMLNGFALVAVLISLTVLGTVVAASLPSRRKQLALLRLIGASRLQLAVTLVVESAVTAVLGGLLALPMGIALVYVVLPILGTVPGVPAIPWSDVVIPILPLLFVPLGAVVGAVIAVTGPAIRGGNVPPADALRHAAGGHESNKVFNILALCAVALTGAATDIAPFLGVVVTLVSSLLFLLALLVAAPAFCGIVAGLVSRFSGSRHPLVDIGAAEVRSFPSRAAATGTAIMLAVAMLALSWISLSSITAIAETRANDDFEPQLVIGAEAGSESLDPIVQQAAASVQGIHNTVSLSIGNAQLTGPSSSEANESSAANEEGSAGRPVRLIKEVAVGHAEEFASLTGGKFPLEQSDPRTVYLPDSEQTPFPEDSEVTLHGPSGEARLTVHYVQDLPLPGLVDPVVMDKVGIPHDTRALWLSLNQDAYKQKVLESEKTIATIAGDLPITGSVVSTAKLNSLMMATQRIATAMLAFAVLIAVLGAMVTVTASLRDRAGELAVLRILGMESAQLRRLVGTETLVVGTVSVLIGLAAGSLLGVAAVVAIARALGVEAQIFIPLLPLAAMGVLAILSIRMAVTRQIDTASGVAPATALRATIHGGKS